MADDKKRSPYDIAAILEQMTIDLILSMRRNLTRHKSEETAERFRWEMWQRVKLRSIASYRKANSKIIRAAFREAEKLTDDVIKRSFQNGERRQQSLWNRFVNLILKPFGYERVPVTGDIPIPRDINPKVKPPKPLEWDKLPRPIEETQFFGLNEKKLDALQESVTNDLKKAQHGVLRKMDDVYRQVIYKAEVNMAAGAKTLDQAIDMATKDFLARGIDSIQYADGRRVNITTWAEMALRTASQRATFLGEGKKRNEWGVYTVVMSAHDNCSPWCLPYQGTVMIDDVYANGTQDVDPKLVLLSEAMRNGAFHPNCRHTLATFFPGISRLPAPIDEEKAKRNYGAEQRQRYMERQIRKYKRLEAGTLDETTQAKYSKKVQEWQDRLRQHLEEHPELRRDRRREKVDGELTSSERKAALKAQDEFLEYQKVLGTDIPDYATFDQLRNSEDWSKVQLDYRRRKRLIDNPNLALPNVTIATAAEAKFTKYLFNPDNQKGWPKGVAFTSRLGYNADNWQELRQEILKRAKLYPVTHKRANKFGKLYEQKTIMYGKYGRPTNVIVGWIEEQGSTKMTSVYIKEVKTNAED